MIAHIGDEIRSRGHEYSYDIVLSQRETAPVTVSNALGLAPGASVFHVICVHRENGLPVQLEDRYVNPAIAPDFLKQDFSTARPSEYLFETVPAHDVEHVVDAGLPTRAEAELLEIRADEPCLTLMRRTWTSGVAVTFARFVHPGSRYRLGCRFTPDTVAAPGLAARTPPCPTRPATHTLPARWKRDAGCHSCTDVATSSPTHVRRHSCRQGSPISIIRCRRT